jgi:hypothetical protein
MEVFMTKNRDLSIGIVFWGVIALLIIVGGLIQTSGDYHWPGPTATTVK